MKSVTIYTTAVCPYCVRAKNLFSSLGIAYREVSLENDFATFQRLSRENGGWRTVPMIFIGDRFVGGYDDIHALHTKGELLPLVHGKTADET